VRQASPPNRDGDSGSHVGKILVLKANVHSENKIKKDSISSLNKLQRHQASAKAESSNGNTYEPGPFRDRNTSTHGEFKVWTQKMEASGCVNDRKPGSMNYRRFRSNRIQPSPAEHCVRLRLLFLYSSIRIIEKKRLLRPRTSSLPAARWKSDLVKSSMMKGGTGGGSVPRQVHPRVPQGVAKSTCRTRSPTEAKKGAPARHQV